VRPAPDRPRRDRPARRLRRAAGIAACAAGLLAAGCGGQAIDPEKASIAVEYDVEDATGARVDHVTCPSGVEVEAGNRFECRVTTVGGEVAIAELEVLNERADVRLIRLRKG